MTIDGAVIKEQGVTFAIVIVKLSAIQTNDIAAQTRMSFQGLFPGLPLVLAAQDAGGTFTYHGRPDLVDFLASINPSRIPWKRYTLS